MLELNNFKKNPKIDCNTERCTSGDRSKSGGHRRRTSGAVGGRGRAGRSGSRGSVGSSSLQRIPRRHEGAIFSPVGTFRPPTADPSSTGSRAADRRTRARGGGGARRRAPEMGRTHAATRGAPRTPLPRRSELSAGLLLRPRRNALVMLPLELAVVHHEVGFVATSPPP
jgi:hypothetical protein